MLNQENDWKKLCRDCRSQSDEPTTKLELTGWTQNTLKLFEDERKKISLLSLHDWEGYIQQHPAHRHPWYDYLSEEASLNDFANFFFENQGVPTFLALVQRTLPIQLTVSGKNAVLENISDEQNPVPHALLMKRLVKVLEPYAKCDESLLSISLANRQLAIFSGYQLDPWQLTGSLFAIEAMGSYRMKRMWEGLSRLGLSDYDLEYAKIHITCDEHHAEQWCESVIQTSLEKNPALLSRIVNGIVLVLGCDEAYLEDCIRFRFLARPSPNAIAQSFPSLA